MIGERARTLVTRIEQLRTVRAQVDDADAYKTRAEQIEALVQRFPALMEAVKALRAAGIEGAEMSDRLTGVRAQIASLREFYESDPEKFAAGQGEFAAFRRTVELYATELEQRVRRAWLDYATAKIPSLSADVLNVLGKVPAFASAIADVRRGLQSLQTLAAALPSPALLERFSRELAPVSEALGNLAGTELPAEVRRFLLSAASYEGAELSLYTQAVQHWIEANQVGASFRVRVASQ